MHIYAFGSLCRGDIDEASDVDLLALVSGYDKRFDTTTFSVYGYDRISQLWLEGNPFAWHLSREAKLIHASDGSDFLSTLGMPASYCRAQEDCRKFYALFLEAQKDLNLTSPSLIFDLSTIFLSIRNFASCYLLGAGAPNFSRNAALQLGSDSVPLRAEDYEILARSRLICTRGVGARPTDAELECTISATDMIEAWFKNMLKKGFEI